MNENFTSNYSKNDDFSMNTEECDYKNLVNRLKKINENISLLKKQKLDKF